MKAQNTTGNEDKTFEKLKEFASDFGDMIDYLEAAIERLDAMIIERDSEISDLKGEMVELRESLAAAKREGEK